MLRLKRIIIFLTLPIWIIPTVILSLLHILFKDLVGEEEGLKGFIDYGRAIFAKFEQMFRDAE